MRSIRCGRGLGDSLYLQSVVRHFIRHRQERLSVCTDWPDVFLPIREHCELVPFRRNEVNIPAHYVMRKAKEGTTQFEDCCHAAGLMDPVELKLEWRAPQGRLVDQVLQTGKPVVCVALPRAPMGREDGFGHELLPDCGVIQRLIERLQGVATVVQIGAGKPLYRFDGIHVDLANRTSVAEMIDVAAVSCGMLGYCSFILPLAESLDKPLMLVWSHRGLKSTIDFIRTVTPEKLLHKASSMWVLDKSNDERIAQAGEDMAAAIVREGTACAS